MIPKKYRLMAFLQSQNRKENPNRAKHSLSVDLTPMVDLGFLLITFFIMTTTLSEAKQLPYQTPIKNKADVESIPNAAKESTVITCLLSEGATVYTYRGIARTGETELKKLSLNNGTNSLRNELIDFKKEVQLKKQSGKLHTQDRTLMIIKPDTNCTFNSLVEVLNDIEITQIESRITLPITSLDRQLISAY